MLDGEIVALDEEGRSRFQLLQQGNRELIVLFDILWLDGHDLRHLPYADRRELLEKTLRVSGARRAPLGAPLRAARHERRQGPAPRRAARPRGRHRQAEVVGVRNAALGSRPTAPPRAPRSVPSTSIACGRSWM
ncbi:MAG TPA: hypothetical protein VI670_13445 [Thermoanaerobaculia bacterium]